MENIFQFDRPGIGSTIMYTAIEGFLLIFLVIAIEVCISRTFIQENSWKIFFVQPMLCMQEKGGITIQIHI